MLTKTGYRLYQKYCNYTIMVIFLFKIGIAFFSFSDMNYTVLVWYIKTYSSE